jgi:hypothetical protein
MMKDVTAIEKKLRLKKTKRKKQNFIPVNSFFRRGTIKSSQILKDKIEKKKVLS